VPECLSSSAAVSRRSTSASCVQGIEYGLHTLREFSSWLAGLESIGDMHAHEQMRVSVCWRHGSDQYMAVHEAVALARPA